MILRRADDAVEAYPLFQDAIPTRRQHCYTEHRSRKDDRRETAALVHAATTALQLRTAPRRAVSSEGSLLRYAGLHRLVPPDRPGRSQHPNLQRRHRRYVLRTRRRMEGETMERVPWG